MCWPSIAQSINATYSSIKQPSAGERRPPRVSLGLLVSDDAAGLVEVQVDATPVEMSPEKDCSGDDGDERCNNDDGLLKCLH